MVKGEYLTCINWTVGEPCVLRHRAMCTHLCIVNYLVMITFEGMCYKCSFSLLHPLGLVSMPPHPFSGYHTSYVSCRLSEEFPTLMCVPS